MIKKSISGVKPPKKIKSVLFSVIRYYMLLVVGYVVLYPVIYMISTSVKSEKALIDVSFVWFPKFITTDWFKNAFDMLSFNNALLRSLSLQIVSAFIEVFVCAVIAYGFARFNFKIKRVAMFFLILSLMIPLPMYGMPLSINYRNLDFLGIFGLINRLTGIDLRLNIFNTNWCYWLPSLFGVGIRSGMIIYIYIQFFQGLPAELEDAAYVDGAGAVRTFFKIALPSSSVVITTVTVLSFIWHWNETYLSQLCFLDADIPLSVAMDRMHQLLQQHGMFLENTPKAAPIILSACLLYIIIPLGLYLILQRKFVKSIDRVGITG